MNRMTYFHKMEYSVPFFWNFALFYFSMIVIGTDIVEAGVFQSAVSASARHASYCARAALIPL
jgi:hypothetical protein